MTLLGLSLRLSSMLKSFCKMFARRSLIGTRRFLKNTSVAGSPGSENSLRFRDFRLVDVSNPVDLAKSLQLSYITSQMPQRSPMELFLTSGWSTRVVMYIVRLSLGNPDYPH